MIDTVSIVDAFASTGLQPVWRQDGDAVSTACGLTALHAAGIDVPAGSDCEIIDGWEGRSLRQIHDPYYAEVCGQQRVEANRASIIMCCVEYRVARGRWQRRVLGYLIERGTIPDLSVGLHRSYARSLYHMLQRLSIVLGEPVYFLTDGRGHRWISAVSSPEDADIPVTGTVIYYDYHEGSVKEKTLR